jgi:hypothetical protein
MNPTPPLDIMGNQYSHRLWREQCAAARHIRESFGLTKALEYLVGEKLANFILAAERELATARELPPFAAEVRRLFSAKEISTYLDELKRKRKIPRLTRQKLSSVLLRKTK